MTDNERALEQLDALPYLHWIRGVPEAAFNDALADRLREAGWTVHREWSFVPQVHRSGARVRVAGDNLIDVRAEKDGLSLVIESKITSPWQGIGQALMYSVRLERLGVPNIPVVAAPAYLWPPGAVEACRRAGIVGWRALTSDSRR